MDVMDQLLVIRVHYKKAFILITIQNSFFVKHIKFGKRKALKKI